MKFIHSLQHMYCRNFMQNYIIVYHVLFILKLFETDQKKNEEFVHHHNEHSHGMLHVNKHKQESKKMNNCFVKTLVCNWSGKMLKWIKKKKENIFKNNNFVFFFINSSSTKNKIYYILKIFYFQWQQSKVWHNFSKLKRNKKKNINLNLITIFIS